jgi:membrane protein required for colicin V production
MAEVMTMGWVDMALLVVLAASVIVGIVRGLVFELMSLLGWLVAWMAAQWLAADVAPFIPVGEPQSAMNHAAAFAATFVLALIVWSLVARLLRMLIHATPLSWPDRLLGAVFGLLRGVLVLLAVATVVGLTPLLKSNAWQASVGAHWLHAALHGLKPLLPESISKHLPAAV